jgi:diguanylate cyclase (GGDEF)-like protein
VNIRLPCLLAAAAAAWRWRAWVLAAGLLLVQAGAWAAAVPELMLHAGQPTQRVADRYLLLEDPGRASTAEQVIEQAGRWQPGQGAELNLAHSPSAWWLRLRLRNAEAAPLARVLELQNPRLDDVQVHVLRAGGGLAEVHRTGDRLPFETRALPYHGFAFPIAFAPGETVDVLVRLDSHDGYFGLLPLALLSEPAFQEGMQRHTLLCGLYYGGLLVLLLYHLCLFASTREASFAWYAGYLASLLATRFAFEGHAAQYLGWPPAWVNQGLLLSYSLSIVFFGVMLLANLKRQLAMHPWLQQACWAVVVLNALPLPLALSGAYSGTLKIALPATLLSVVFAMGLSLWAWRQGLRHTRFFLAGGACLLLGLLVERLRLESALPDHPLLAYGVAIGSVLEALFVALALAEGMNRLKTEKLDAERLAREAESRLNGQLGQLVQARTLELEAANERLTTLSITDELTGACNRRHFHHEMNAQVDLARRAGSAVGLCLFDLDHFKGYNDRYGHPAGDEVLRRVAAAVQGQLKRSTDRLFRIGGEEFALLLSGSAGEAAPEGFVAGIRAAIEALGIPHEAHASGVVTASFGLAWCRAGAELTGSDALYRAADEQLYHAKASGRNGVASGELQARALDAA